MSKRPQATNEPAAAAPFLEPNAQVETPQVEVLPELVNFPEPVSAADQTAVIEDTAPQITAAELKELHRQADMENDKRDFVAKVMATREVPVEPPKPAPLAPRVVSQTQAELEAGKAQVKKNEEHWRHHHGAGGPKQEEDTKTVAVFRPSDYVPDQKKGQGQVQARNL